MTALGRALAGALGSACKAALFALLAVSGAVHAQAESDVARQVKAAYLYKFGNYIEWPPGSFERADSPLVIGVMGADKLADELARIVAGRTLQGRKIAVRKIASNETPAAVNVLFIGRSLAGRTSDILASIKGSPVLTVTESDQALTQGSMINFVEVDGKIRFEVAPQSASSGRLSISARLLSAAHKVVTGRA